MAVMWRLLLIDETVGIRGLLEDLFNSAEAELIGPRSHEETLGFVRGGGPDIAIIGLGRGGEGGLQWAKEIRALDWKLPMIFVHEAEPETAMTLGIKDGVFDEVHSPIDPSDFMRRIKVALRAAHDLKSRVIYGTEGRWEPFQEVLLGQSAGMQNVFGAIERLAHSEACTLISGESGTGKDLVARVLHHHGQRCEHFLITVDCLDRQEILDRALFGQRDPHGFSRLDQAAGGTLLLDHVERMPPPIQSKLVEVLRGLVGSGNQHERPRILAASTGRLEQALADRTFRADLFDILSAERIDLPPLRDRLEDVALIASYFLGRLAAGTGQRPKSLSAIVSRILSQYPWPGNVRELELVLRRAASAASADLIQLGDLPQDFLNAAGPTLLEMLTSARAPKGASGLDWADFAALSRRLFEWARNDPQFQLIPAVERELVVHAMAETNGNRVQAAKLLGITRATLRKRLLRFNIRREILIR